MTEKYLEEIIERLDAKGLAILTVFGIAGFTGDMGWDLVDFLDPEYVGAVSGAIPAVLRVAAHQQYNEWKTKKRRMSLVNNVEKVRQDFFDAGDLKACERLDRQINARKYYDWSEQDFGRAIEKVYDEHLGGQSE